MELIALGYDLERETGRSLIRRFGRTSGSRSVLRYVSFNVQMVTFVVLGSVAWALAPALLAIPALLVLGVLASRTWRGFENMVHEASHHNLCRQNPRLNELLGDLLCGAASMHILTEYRDAHNRHHLFFSSEADPDLKQYRALGVDLLPTHMARREYARAAVTALRYWIAHFTRLKRGKVTARLIMWYALFAVAPAGAILTALHLPLQGMLVPGTIIFLLSPLVRLVAESSEHDYTKKHSTFDGTFTNLGWFEFFFPLNDCFHLLHHLVPTIPFFALREANHFMAARDSVRFAHASRKRGNVTRFFGSAQPGEA